MPNELRSKIGMPCRLLLLYIFPDIGNVSNAAVLDYFACNLAFE